jgi:signal transduction histidine kinase/ActR/RegA family two-component response regulator
MMQTFADILTPASLEMALQRLGEEISREGREPGSGGQPTTLEVEVYRKDGSTVWTEVQASFLRDAMGRAVGLLGVSRDITQRRLLEDQLRHAQRLEVVGRLAGGVAHDFNNLLMAILGYNDLLLGGLSPNSTLYFYAREIRKAGERAADLTRQLLSFSRRQALLPQAVDLNQLLGNLRPMLERLLGEHTSLTFQPDPALWQVLVDAGEMEQVILNLVVNARDAMPQGGRLAITTANVSLNQDYVRIHADVQPGDYVRLTVQDSGGGMTPEVMNRIFEPFFTTKDVGQGTGLGLSMVYGTVRQSQGYIQVSSAPGQGARFEVFLPRMTPPGAAAPTPAAPPAPDPAAALRGRETILLVEDEEMVRTLAAMALRGQGYTVVEAANGRQAQDMFEADPASIALLITDVAMPGEDGWELAQRLISQAPGLKVIVMSGYAEAARAAALAAGPPVVYLEKPFDSMTLLSKVRELLDQKD